MVTIEQLVDLQSPDGERLLAELGDLSATLATSIAVATQLRKMYPAALVSAAMTMHGLRIRGRVKFNRADGMWFTRDGLEQATSESIATWRAGRYREFFEIVDLCCGIGGDLLAIAAGVPQASLTAVDRDPLHLAMARSNAAAQGLHDRVDFVEADVRGVAVGDQAAVFIDPARRSERGRMTAGESDPPLEWCLALASGARAVGIKCAPGLDRDRIPAQWEFEAIAVGTDLKETVLWSPHLAKSDRAATVIGGATIHQLHPVEGESVMVRMPEAGSILLDPNPAVTRSGLVEDLARTVGAMKIDDWIGFLVSESPVSSPFARSFRIVDSAPWNERLLKARLRKLGAGSVVIRRRGLAGDVDSITRRLRGQGDRPLTIAMTRVMNEPWALICEGC